MIVLYIRCTYGGYQTVQMDETLLVGFFDHYAFNADIYHVKKFGEERS